MEIYPAIDLCSGKAVRLLRGEADQETVYSDSPADMARRWAAEGATYLHVVDLDGAHALPACDPVSTLVYATRGSDVRALLVDGRLLVDRGQLTAATGLDLDRLRAHCRERVPALFRRAGLG